LSPILCPHIRLPYKRIKEPYYASIKEVAAWFSKAGVSGVEAASPTAPTQQSLF
jgi:hypothetical protein